MPSFESPSLLLPIAESEPVADAVAELAAMVERALDDGVWITAVAVDELIIERISDGRLVVTYHLLDGILLTNRHWPYSRMVVN